MWKCSDLTQVGPVEGNGFGRVHEVAHSHSLPWLRSASSMRGSSRLMINALHEALSESILPTPPPRAKLPSSPSLPHPLFRPPPRISSLRHPSPVTLTLSPSLSLATPVHPTRSSLDTLRLIHTSTVPQVPTSPSARRWWFQSDPDTSRETVARVLDESNLVGGDLGKKCASLVCISFSNQQTPIP